MNNDDFSIKTGTDLILADLVSIGKDLVKILDDQMDVGISQNPNDPWYTQLKFVLANFAQKWDLADRGYTMDILPNGYENDYYGIGATILIKGHGNRLTIKIGS